MSRRMRPAINSKNLTRFIDVIDEFPNRPMRQILSSDYIPKVGRIIETSKYIRLYSQQINAKRHIFTRLIRFHSLSLDFAIVSSVKV